MTTEGGGGRLRDLIEELGRIERRREGATPGSSEYIELVGFERRLVEQIDAMVRGLDVGPFWQGGGRISAIP